MAIIGNIPYFQTNPNDDWWWHTMAIEDRVQQTLNWLTIPHSTPMLASCAEKNLPGPRRLLPLLLLLWQEARDAWSDARSVTVKMFEDHCSIAEVLLSELCTKHCKSDGVSPKSDVTKSWKAIWAPKKWPMIETTEMQRILKGAHADPWESSKIASRYPE